MDYEPRKLADGRLVLWSVFDRRWLVNPRFTCPPGERLQLRTATRVADAAALDLRDIANYYGPLTVACW